MLQTIAIKLGNVIAILLLLRLLTCTPNNIVLYLSLSLPPTLPLSHSLFLSPPSLSLPCVLLYVYYYCIARVHCFIILLNGCTTISSLTVNIVLYCVLRYIISLSAIDINRRLSLLSYVFMLTLYCFSILSVYLYLYIFHIIINIIDIMLCISKTVNIVNFVYICPTAQLGLNKSSIYLSLSPLSLPLSLSLSLSLFPFLSPPSLFPSLSLSLPLFLPFSDTLLLIDYYYYEVTLMGPIIRRRR